MSEKIPCSVGILTLNSGAGLRRCLLSLADFAEIIVCDGNSTDDTLAIAREYGAKIIKQYDSDEPNLRCITDKANVRMRNMSAAKYPWYFFLDSDDTLSPEAVREIRAIVTTPHPPYLMYKMPSRIFIDGKEIKHEVSYPSYQTRLVHMSVGARFKGRVHERLIWDEKKFRAGILKSFYDFHWPAERVRRFWEYQKMYARLERDVFEVSGPWSGFCYWGVYRRIRIICGYLYRIPLQYLRFGFKETLPLRLELLILWSHLYILGLFIGKKLTYYVRH